MNDQTSKPVVVVWDDRHLLHVMRFPAGKIDGGGVRLMYELAVAAIDRHDRRLLVDFTGVKHLTSGVLGMLVTLKKKCLGIGAQMQVLVPEPQAMETLHLMNLHRVLSLADTFDEAFAHFKPSASPSAPGSAGEPITG
ncbi:MAG: STAS domain-containing protein [Phycisphaeraceae bacterium]|nr:STAS domain-containing protein [Phycisphaeraceae bacterium]